ncbi:MAG: type IIA DNA topoisomerase subunit B [Lentisphaerae bacterium]|nr:type IIA DNA topoisomerase subunit B [Lentisphaerota bacterium]
MAKPTTHIYDESKIKTLSSLDHIRKRTGMYIGRLGDGTHYDDGIYVLLKEVVDNAVDEFIMGHGKRVDITVVSGEVSVRDYGRGIPLGKVVECVSRINTGAKYNDDVFQFSVGLNGVGTKAVNALSSRFLVRSVREGKYVEAVFERGVLANEKQGKAADEADGTFIRFTPDRDIFGAHTFDMQFVARRIRMYTYLNAGLEFLLNGESLISDGGLRDLIEEEADSESIYPVLHHTSKTLEVALTHSPRFHETHFSFVNGQFTSDGGTHLSAFREGILKAFNEFSKKHFEGDDVREGLIGAVAIRLKEPVFESQTKNKLGNTEIRGDLVAQIRDVVVDLLHRNPLAAEKALLKIEETQKLRKELANVKKLAREKARAVSIRVPQLKDSKLHLDKRRGRGHESMIFITEGLSAAGSIVSCRDPNTQAIFTLKGKPLNVCDLNRDAIYKNDELYNLMRALQIEDSSESLRYHRVILATDADVDGLHIRNLLITFFLRFFEPTVYEGHVHILETPLFRARNKKETRYCYSEAERDAATAALGSGCEVTRFKGLGEISPKEFKQFIGPDMRLSPVSVENQHAVPHLLNFYMGKNTPERRRYILENLVVDEAL